MNLKPVNKINAIIWGDELKKRGRLGVWVSIALRYVYAVMRDLFSGQLTMRGMSLVYTTLLSVVPLIALSFSVLKGFGVDDVLEQRMFVFVEPLGERGIEIAENVMRLVRNVNGGVLGGISLAFFIYTAVSMIQKVEESFNYVWYVSKARSFARRFTEYMFVLLVGPVVVVIALGMITSLQNESIIQYLLNNDIVGPLFVATGKLVPYILVMAVFTFLYAFIPNAKVGFKSALIGGISGGFMWATLSVVFTAFVVNSARTQAVYAGFAIAVITLIWIYLNWVVLLLGSQIAFYVQNPAYLRHGRREPTLSNTVRERLALNTMLLVGLKFRDQSQTITVETLSEKLRLPSLSVAPVIDALENAGLLTADEAGHLLPGKDPTKVSIEDVFASVRYQDLSSALLRPDWHPSVESMSKDVDMAIAKAIGTKTLAELLDDVEDAK